MDSTLNEKVAQALAARAAEPEMPSAAPKAPAVDADVEAARMARQQASPTRPWAEPQRARRRQAAPVDPDVEVHKLAMQLLREEQAIHDEVLQARAEKRYRDMDEARGRLRATRKFRPNSMDDTGLPEGIERRAGFVYRWVARTDSWGRDDPRRTKVQHWRSYGGEVVQDAKGKDIEGHYGVLMAIPYEGCAERMADSAPRGAAALSDKTAELEDDVARFTNRAGQPYARLTGAGAQVVTEE